MSDWACLVTFLNQTADQTSDSARQVHFEVNGQTATCRVGSDLLHVDFAVPWARLERVSVNR